MPVQLSIAALGTVVDLVFDEAASESFIAAIAHAWSRCLVDFAAEPDGSGLQPSEPLVVAGPVDGTDEAARAAMQRLSQQVTLHLIATQTGRLLMFHAGAVSEPACGDSVVFVAPSGTGKTTLASLLGRSLGYLTDETVGIDLASRAIHPYPKPLSMAPAGRRAKVEISPDDLGLVPAHPTPKVSRILLLNRQPGLAGPPGLDELGTIDAIAALIPETSALNRLPRPLHAVADLLAATGPVLRCTYREARDIVPLVPELMGEPS